MTLLEELVGSRRLLKYGGEGGSRTACCEWSDVLFLRLYKGKISSWRCARGVHIDLVQLDVCR